MNVEKETLVILLLLALVLAPLWFFALYSAEPQTPVALSQTEGVIEPTGRFLPTPVAVNELVAGVITWVALFVLMGMIFYTHQLIRSVGQAEEPIQSDEPVATDGAGLSLPSYLLDEDRRLVEYWPATYSTTGLVAIALSSALSVVFAVLFALEALTLARTQYLGIYGGIVFLSLGALVAFYATWFVPSVHVVEKHDHEEIVEPDAEDSQ